MFAFVVLGPKYPTCPIQSLLWYLRLLRPQLLVHLPLLQLFLRSNLLPVRRQRFRLSLRLPR